MSEDRLRKIRELEARLDKMWSDPDLSKKVEEFQRKHGILTPEELHQRVDGNFSTRRT
ncbi:MAG: hypothetical protein ACXQTM_08330 [Methanosarcinales archaeon]